MIEYSVETEKDKRSAREKLRYVEIIRVVRKFGLDRAQRARLGLRAAKKKEENMKRGGSSSLTASDSPVTLWYSSGVASL